TGTSDAMVVKQIHSQNVITKLKQHIL
ncbi:MAG: hypothetical protein ACI9QN_002147, partial [Arcticibacterium sp.]